MAEDHDKVRYAVALTAVAAMCALGACSKSNDTTQTSEATTTNTTSTAPAATGTETANTTTATTTATTAAAVPADNTDTVSGVKLAAYKGDATSGATVFIQCKTCHSIDQGQNRIGPSLHGVVGRHSGTIANFTYSSANKNSGITWTEEKLFQYLENPQRVVPGTKMTFTGVKDPQKRADVIAYLKSNS